MAFQNEQAWIVEATRVIEFAILNKRLSYNADFLIKNDLNAS